MRGSHDSCSRNQPMLYVQMRKTMACMHSGGACGVLALHMRLLDFSEDVVI